MVVKRRARAVRAPEGRRLLVREKRPVRVAAPRRWPTRWRARGRRRRNARSPPRRSARCDARLKVLDKVAFVRFASVYRNLRDIDEFKNELNDLLRTWNERFRFRGAPGWHWPSASRRPSPIRSRPSRPPAGVGSFSDRCVHRRQPRSRQERCAADVHARSSCGAATVWLINGRSATVAPRSSSTA